MVIVNFYGFFNRLLDRINQDVVEFEQIRSETFKSLNVLSSIIVAIFKHKGIMLNPLVALGDIDQSINSEFLSAGEKQMLSFLCYNAFYSNCPFFIDEPELSLHVDWQRILLDVLIEQKTNNQLFIATHSPFIYTQYEDKEIMIGDDRGDSSGK
jgi:predicted ATP-dependent endonuclease of OLD family